MRASCSPWVGRSAYLPRQRPFARFVHHRDRQWSPRPLPLGTLQSWKAQRFDCLCDAGPTFRLSLHVVGYGIDHLLVFGRVFRISNVKGVAFKSLHICNEFLLGRLSSSPHVLAEFLGPLNLGFGLRHVFSFFLVCTTGGVPSKEACAVDDGRGSPWLLSNNVDATYLYRLLPWRQHIVPKCNLAIRDY